MEECIKVDEYGQCRDLVKKCEMFIKGKPKAAKSVDEVKFCVF